MARILVCVTALALCTVTATAQEKQEFLKHGDVITGQVRVVHKTHPNGTPLVVYQIVSDAPKKFAQKDEFCKAAPPKTFHLVLSDNKAKTIRLKRLVGKKTEIVADDFMCSQTAWHIGDAVVPKWRFTGPEKR
jgi:hypothetical protein